MREWVRVGLGSTTGRNGTICSNYQYWRAFRSIRDDAMIKTGPNGICNTTQNDDDVQVIPVGKGEPNTTAITAGSNGILNTTPSGDDTIVGTTITTGADGICNTTKSGDDVQVISVNQGKSNTMAITVGTNKKLDTSPSVDDTSESVWINDDTYDNELEEGNVFWGSVPPTP